MILVVVLVVVLALIALSVWQRSLIGRARRWFVRAVLGSPPAPLVPSEADENGDPLVSAVRRLAERVHLGESFNRTISRIIVVLIPLIVLLVIVSIATVSLVFANLRQSDRREADRKERTIAACEQDRQTRSDINAGNDAKDALKVATSAVQDEIDAILGPLLTAPDASLTDEQRAFRQRYAAGRATVEDKLALADERIQRARVPDRDCTLDAIDAFLSTTTTSQPR